MLNFNDRATNALHRESSLRQWSSSNEFPLIVTPLHFEMTPLKKQIVSLTKTPHY